MILDKSGVENEWIEGRKRSKAPRLPVQKQPVSPSSKAWTSSWRPSMPRALSTFPSLHATGSPCLDRDVVKIQYLKPSPRTGHNQRHDVHPRPFGSLDR